ncbi:hypothetical protein HBI13_089270 [Parastagonospora nodorum]|nr:hypothetical protein HBI10_007560 [Parastagonospora nodorum]KAH4023505.1 hypothetical protein HBI13_089270 [Parastagonospora nodorum]KAH4976049.1 hypothetical protein HBH73_041820 [Parastagonospora nodorum]KAH5458605.1 hypothetical protein HBI30_055840 [Parastagonospora nodorum]KAH5798304.1 hypothetical protein HBI97_008870 [Parastagonospora nodorum]
MEGPDFSTWHRENMLLRHATRDRCPGGLPSARRTKRDRGSSACQHLQPAKVGPAARNMGDTAGKLNAAGLPCRTPIITDDNSLQPRRV